MKNIYCFYGIATTILLLALVIGTLNEVRKLDIDSRAEFVRGIVANFNCENPGEFFLKSGDEVVGYKPICE